MCLACVEITYSLRITLNNAFYACISASNPFSRSVSVRNPDINCLVTCVLYGVLYTLVINEILIICYLVEIYIFYKSGIYIALYSGKQSFLL